jgi:hypothetical protein
VHQDRADEIANKLNTLLKERQDAED